MVLLVRGRSYLMAGEHWPLWRYTGGGGGPDTFFFSGIQPFAYRISFSLHLQQ